MNLSEKQFRTHKGKLVTGERLVAAHHAVADHWAANARAIRQEDGYASHVTEAEKGRFMQEQLEQAERIRKGTERMGFWLWQRINTELTGECVPFLPGVGRGR
jgi:hypothetical protein